MFYDYQLLIAVIASITAAVGSIFNIYITKKRITSETFTKFRHKRYKEIKKGIGDFFDIYSEEAMLEPINRNKLKRVLLKIELMFNYYDSSVYNNLKKKLYNYLESPLPITDHQPLIIETHKLFNWIMAKAKLEAGITPKVEVKYFKILKKQFNKCNDCNIYCERNM